MTHPPRRGDAIPAASLRRLSRYLRHLESLQRLGRPTVSSRAIGNALSLTDAQIRKDLSRLGHVGSPGVGYRVPDLVRHLRHAIGTDEAWDVILVGAGNLGRALASHGGFTDKGIRIVGVFDADPAKVGQVVSIGHESVGVQSIAAVAPFVAARGIRLAILAVPADVAQGVAEQVVAAGVHGILNFAPTGLTLPPTVRVEYVDLAAQLERLIYAMHNDALANADEPTHAEEPAAPPVDRPVA